MDIVEYGKELARLGQMLQDEESTITEIVAQARKIGLTIHLGIGDREK